MVINCESDYGYRFENDEVISNYLKDVRKIPLLTLEEEKELLTIYHTTKDINEKIKVRNKLIESNLRFVISVARKFGTSESFYDLISEGNLGLLKAIEKYDINSNCKFISYAVNWIIQFIQSYQLTKQKAIRPKNVEKLNRFVRSAYKDLYAINERKPTYEEIVEYCREKYGYSITNVNDVSFGNCVLSINEHFDDNDDSETFEASNRFNSVTMSNNINDYIEKDDIHTKVDYLLHKLNSREAEIVKRKLGIGCEEESFDTISMHFNYKIGKERIRQIYISAIKKLKEFA